MMVNGYNPMIDYQRNQLLAQQAMIQQQLSQLGQMSPQQNYQPQTNPLQTQYFAKEVNGFDETKRVIPNPSEIYIFLDSNAGKIYLKQMNSENGRAEYLTYNIDKTDDTAKDPIEAINERLSAIESKIGGLYESVSGNAKIQSVQGEPDGYADGQFHPEPVRANGTAESAEISANPTDVKRKERKPAS